MKFCVSVTSWRNKALSFSSARMSVKASAQPRDWKSGCWWPLQWFTTTTLPVTSPSPVPAPKRSTVKAHIFLMRRESNSQGVVFICIYHIASSPWKGLSLQYFSYPHRLSKLWVCFFFVCAFVNDFLHFCRAKGALWWIIVLHLQNLYCQHLDLGEEWMFHSAEDSEIWFSSEEEWTWMF